MDAGSVKIGKEHGLTIPQNSGILEIENGFLICPRCRRNRKVLRITPQTSGKRIIVYCAVCKSEFAIDIDHGKAKFSQSETRG